MGRTTATTAQHRHSRRARVGRLARVQGGIVSRRQLYAAGLTRWEVQAELRAGRRAPTGKQTVRVGEAQPDGIWWRAVLEIGPSAAIDGVSALMIAGLRTIEESTVHVAVRKSSTPMRSKGVTVHETRRYREEDILRAGGPPRTRPAAAAVHAALWARTDKQAALFVIAAVQQRLVPVGELAEQVALVRWHPAVGCSAPSWPMSRPAWSRWASWNYEDVRGPPIPPLARQVRRTTPSGRIYLDVRFRTYPVSVEIDGAQHLDAGAAAGDALKQNAVALEGDIVIRIPVWALRTDPHPFLDQVDAALKRCGWRGPDASG